MILNKTLIAMLPGMAKTGEVREALLPCPFCGGEAQLTEVEPSGYVVECTNGICNASTNIRYSCGEDARPLVREQWNRRTLSAEVERLQARLGEAEALAVKWRGRTVHCSSNLDVGPVRAQQYRECADELDDVIAGRAESV